MLKEKKFLKQSKKIKFLVLGSMVSLLLSACGGGGNNDNNDDPIVDSTIRGQINDTLPSAALPSSLLPSVEVDESPTAIAAVRTLNITLQGEQEVRAEPLIAGNESLKATAVVAVNETTGDVSITVTATDIGDANITMAHIHSGFAGSNGPVIAGLNQTAEGVYSAETNIANFNEDPGSNLETFLDGGWYINLHTELNAPGQLRGQIVPDGVQAVRIELEGQQENPPVENAAGISGVGYATINAAEEEIVINTSVVGFVPELAAPIGPVHLHSAFAGANGGVILPLSPVGDSQVNYTGTQADILSGQVLDYSTLLQGGHYINIHSAANPGGELRGQVVTSGVEVIRSELQGQQENPPVENAAGISGVNYATINASAESIVLNTTVIGFEPQLDAPIGPVHLHSAFAGVNGGVVLPLSLIENTEPNPNLVFSYTGTEADILDGQTLDFAQLAQGGHYINVHSAENAGGELRGQLVSSNSKVLRAELEGSQALPADNVTAANGIGYITITDIINGQFLSNLTVNGLADTLATVNVRGNNNETFIELIAGEEPNTFSSAVGDVFNINGLQNGAYSFQAIGTEAPFEIE